MILEFEYEKRQLFDDVKNYLGKYDREWVNVSNMNDDTVRYNTRGANINWFHNKFITFGLVEWLNSKGETKIIDLKEEYTLEKVLYSFKKVMDIDDIQIKSVPLIEKTLKQNEEIDSFMTRAYNIMSHYLKDFGKVQVYINLNNQMYSFALVVRKSDKGERIKILRVDCPAKNLSIFRINQPYYICENIDDFYTEYWYRDKDYEYFKDSEFQEELLTELKRVVKAHEFEIKDSTLLELDAYESSLEIQDDLNEWER